MENFLTNQLMKGFWKSVHICRSYHQASRAYFLGHSVFRQSLVVLFGYR